MICSGSRGSADEGSELAPSATRRSKGIAGQNGQPWSQVPGKCKMLVNAEAGCGQEGYRRIEDEAVKGHGTKMRGACGT